MSSISDPNEEDTQVVRPAAETPMRVHLTLTPRGVERFAALMHLLAAHVLQDDATGTASHHARAVDYIRAHAREGVAVDRTHACAGWADYAVTNDNGQPPTLVRVFIGRTLERSLALLVHGKPVLIDLASGIKLRR